MKPFTLSRRARKGILFAIVVLGVSCGCLVWLAGSFLSEPVPRSAGRPPDDLQAEDVTFNSGSGSVVRGWLAPMTTDSGCIILMHGVRASRRDMIARAQFLHAAGYTVLLFDFQAHGESSGERITFGYLESMDAQAAVQYVHERLPRKKIGVIGVSLGGAACLLADPPLPVEAMVLEAAYPDIDRAIENRLQRRFGIMGKYLAPLLTLQLRPRLEVSEEQLRPQAHIASVACPIMIIAGTADQHTTIAESRELYAAAREPKEMWEIAGAAHVDFHHFAGSEYERRIRSFLNRCLKKE